MNRKNDRSTRSFFPNINDFFRYQQIKVISYILAIQVANFIIPPIEISAQQIEQSIEHALEELVEKNSEDFSIDPSMEELWSTLHENPIRLNRSNPEVLKELFFLTDIQINALVHHINKYGKLISIYELQAIPHFTPELIEKLLPFIRIDGEIDDRQLNLKELLFKGKYQLIFRFQSLVQKQEGYLDSVKNGYLGSPLKIYSRFRYQHGSDLSYGLTAEKDSGEPFMFKRQNKGFDFYSAHFYIRNLGPLATLVIGDYDIRLGQGLIAWSGFGYGKGSNILSIKKTGRKIIPYTSVDENQFKRGFAASVKWKHIYLTMFCSRKKIDANAVNYDSAAHKADTVTSILNSGLHRTSAELADKNLLSEVIFGGSLEYQKKRWRVGMNSISTLYGTPILKKSAAYNQFELDDVRLHNLSLNYEFLVRNISLFGESAISNNLGYAMLNGMIISLHTRIDLSVLHRFYSKGFQAVHSNSFGENSRTSNERGIYLGISIRPLKHIALKAYVDIYHHEWLRFRTHAPSNGADFLIHATFKPSKNLEMYFRLKNKVKGQNRQGNETTLNYVYPYKKKSNRIHCSFKVSKSFIFNTRFEWTSFAAIDDTIHQLGFQCFQEIHYRPLEAPLSFSGRFAIFRSQSNEVKIYAYESDVLSSTSVPSFIGSGSRFYLLAKLKISRFTDFWVRYSLTRFPGNSRITANSALSSNPGKDGIEGDKVEELKVQVRFKF